MNARYRFGAIPRGAGPRNPRIASRAAACGARALLLAAALLSGGCADRPDPVERLNPFDPGNPATGGDPFRLRATVRGVAVDLEWDEVEVPPLREIESGDASPSCRNYSVYRSSSPESLVARPETLALGLTATAFRDTTPMADRTSYYAVTFLGLGCRESLRSEALAVRIDLAPLVEIRTTACDTCGALTTVSRHVRVFVRAQDADSVSLSNAVADSELVDPATFAIGTAGIDWSLDASASNDDTLKVVFARVRRAGDSLSPIVSDSIAVEPLVALLLVDSLAAGPVLTGRREVSVRIQRNATDTRAPAGAESLEVTFDPPFPGEWVPFDDAFPLPLASPAFDTVHVRVKNDFGIEISKAVSIRPDSLLDARIVLSNTPRLSLPEQAMTSRCRVNVHVSDGRATAICLANTPIPPCATFEPTSGSRLDWALDAADTAVGGVRVFAILANEWRPDGGAVVSDSITLERRAVSVWITSPGRAADSTYTVGDSTVVRGNASRGTCGPAIRSVAVSANGLAIGEATLSAAAVGDTADVLWSVPWRVEGAGDIAKLTAVATDDAGIVDADSIDVVIVPRAAARAAPARSR